MKKRCQELWSAWCDFWFTYDNPLALALLRIQLAAVLLWMYAHRHLYNLMDFGPSALIPRDWALRALPEDMRPPFGWFFWPDDLAAGVHGLFLGLLLLILLGVGARWVAWLAWIIHLGFIQRNYSILFGADVISSVFLFYLAFVRSDERLSIMNWKGRRPPPERPPEMVSSMFARLLQVQLVTIYAYTGFEKLRGASWWDGTALWTVLGNPQMVAFDLDFVRNVPLLIAATTFLTIVFEIYWGAAVAHPKTRKLWLWAGVAFHVGIGLLMSLWTFSLVMLAVYWLFIPRASLESCWDRLRSRRMLS